MDLIAHYYLIFIFIFIKALSFVDFCYFVFYCCFCFGAFRISLCCCDFCFDVAFGLDLAFDFAACCFDVLVGFGEVDDDVEFVSVLLQLENAFHFHFAQNCASGFPFHFVF